MTSQRHANLITKTYLDKALNKVIGSIGEILNDLIQKMDTPTQKEFNEFKNKVNHYYPTL